MAAPKLAPRHQCEGSGGSDRAPTGHSSERGPAGRGCCAACMQRAASAGCEPDVDKIHRRQIFRLGAIVGVLHSGSAPTGESRPTASSFTRGSLETCGSSTALCSNVDRPRQAWQLQVSAGIHMGIHGSLEP